MTIVVVTWSQMSRIRMSWITMTMTRIGNLLVPNNNYVKFEEWLMPILDKMLEEQKNNGVVWTPSKIIHRFHKMSWYVR